MQSVLRVGACDRAALTDLLQGFGLRLVQVPQYASIPGSYWGDEEAGLIDQAVYLRDDTPVHSVLHETCHYLCMSPERRQSLDTNAGGDYDEENAVCYLQVLLAEELPDMGRERMFRDMDAWGYSFRLGSARAWFERDADDALQWLKRYGLVSLDRRFTGKLRGEIKRA
ncbi:MAG: hypothetical protein R3348_02855 [Xanthomonadales bacterium]|nr:hypothetical protein [Xanthomonadales bacterium]